MVSKPHRTNSDFQLKYFLAGSCHTPDGAWSLLYGQKLDIESKIKVQEAFRLRKEAVIIENEKVLNSFWASEAKKKAARANIIEARAGEEVFELNLQAAVKELTTINSLMVELNTQCQYSHLPILERTEAAQQEEWKLELIYRAENYLTTQKYIPHDEFARMREHPEFKTIIAPTILAIESSLATLTGRTKLVLNCGQSEILQLKSAEGEKVDA